MQPRFQPAVRISAEVWNQIKNEDWTMASEVNFLSNWPYRLWSMEKHYHSMGGSTGGGVGYNAPAAMGAALANKEHGRITVALNGDGDLMMSPGVLWTAAHHRIPILYLVHNNRAWHQEYMHVQRMATALQSARYRSRQDRHNNAGSEHRLRHAGKIDGRLFTGTDPITLPMSARRSNAAHRGACWQARRTRADRRRVATALSFH